MGTRKEPVRLRQRKTATGLVSLYLDIYYKGKRQYEYLRMYLVPEHTRADKEQNRETLKMAEAVCAKRIVDLRNGVYGFRDNKPAATDILFFEYFKNLVEQRKEANRSYFPWRAALRLLHKYERRNNITFADITPDWIRGYRDFLDKALIYEIRPMSENTKLLYFDIMRTCLNRAVKDGIISESPALNIDNFKKEDGTRMYLTVDELKRLAATPCPNDGIRRAFLFSCLTGLRRSDVERLTWGDVHQQGEYTRIIFRQKKTRGQEYLDIAPQASELMGEQGNLDERVFRGLLKGSNTNYTIQRWVSHAGIDKKITFHCGRHTFAVMMLDLGTDIYTVSKLLGHKSLSTTQVYAKVMDKNKQRAVSSIPNILK